MESLMLSTSLTIPSAVRLHVQEQLAQQGGKFEIARMIGNIPVDFYMKTGFFSNTAIFCVNTVSEQILSQVSKIYSNLPFGFKQSLVVIVDKLPDERFDFWADVISLVADREKNISFYLADRRVKIGQIHPLVTKVLEAITIMGSGNALSSRSRPVVAPSPIDFDENAASEWVEQIRDIFIKFAVSLGRNQIEQKQIESYRIDVIDGHSFIFKPEITDEVFDQIKEIVTSARDSLPPISLIGSIAPSDVLDRGGEGAAVYALHRNYRWRSAGVGDTSPLFERFLSDLAQVQLATYNRAGRAPLWVVIPALLIGAAVFFTGVSFLIQQQDLNIFIFASIISLAAGAYSGMAFKVGKREYTPSTAYASIFGLGVMAIYLLIMTVSKTFQLFFILEAIVLMDLSLVGGILYAAFTSTPPTYIEPLPSEYRNKPAGTNLTIIRTAINCWDRGWALTIPKMGEVINLAHSTALMGFTTILDSLFEKRYVTVGERAGSHDTGWKLKDAIEFVATRRWTYVFESVPRFDKFKKSIAFPEMSERFICPRCGGSGWVTCSSCGGSGRESYTETEYYTDSDGKQQSRSVTKERTCSRCGGSGRETCSRCAGTGWITQYPVLVCERKHEQTKDCIDPTTERNLEKIIYQGRSKRLLETPILDEIIDIQAKLTKDIPDEIGNLAIALGQKSVSKQSDELHVIRQRLRIAEVPITEVDYEYQNESYRLWVYGNDNDIHAKKAPYNSVRLYSTLAIAIFSLLINVIILALVYSSQQ